MVTEQSSDMELDSEKVPVPQIQEPPPVDKKNKTTNLPKGKPRLRKKALHAAILKQMEFYFSDANLSKDRFLSNLLKDDPYVDLSIFLRCNKIRELTSDLHRVAKALEKSTILSLSEDGTKVCRATPFQKKENEDDCTVYIQNLPPDTDHEWLSALFSKYGTVAYVSIPKYRNNKKIKGFAFIEFETPESAIECLDDFKKRGCVLPSHTNPEDLLSITTFEDEEKDVKLQGRRPPSGNFKPTEANLQTKSTENMETECLEDDTRKRKHDDADIDENSEQENIERKAVKLAKEQEKPSKSDESDDTENSKISTKRKTRSEEQEDKNESQPEAQAKKQKRASTENTSKVQEESNEEPSLKQQKLDMKKNKNKNNEESNENPVEEKGETLSETRGESSKETDQEKEEKDTKDGEKKKKKKRIKRNKIEYDVANLGLEVISKRDWKRLRNKYLDLQRNKMKQLKQHLRKTRWNKWSTSEKNKCMKEETEREEKNIKSETKSENANTLRGFDFVSGVIVKMELNEPCTNPRDFKMELKKNNGIKYIDIQESAFHGYIRCDAPETAKALAQKSNSEQQITILEGEEEKSYWEKMLKDRDEKFNKKVRVKQRGRDKLLKKAEKVLGKHIKFDD